MARLEGSGGGGGKLWRKHGGDFRSSEIETFGIQTLVSSLLAVADTCVVKHGPQ